MCKSDILKLAFRLSAYLNALGLRGFPLMCGLKHTSKRLLMRLFAPDNLVLLKAKGFSMYVHADTAELSVYLLRPYEPYTTELFKRVTKPGATVLDIGAQFGFFSLIAAKQAGQEGKVYAFEPVPANFELLVRNIQMNGYSNVVRAIQKAVGDKETPLILFLYEGSDSHAVYRHPQASVKGTISVECLTVDKFLKGQAVDVVKMDIEGHEPYALQGMKETLSKSDNLTLFAEFAPAYLRRAGVEPGDYLSQLEKLGFYVQLIREDLRCLKPLAKDILQEDNPAWYANLYCTRRGYSSR